jgi:hypothetical protein
VVIYDFVYCFVRYVVFTFLFILCNCKLHKGFKTSLQKSKSDVPKSDTNKVPDLIQDGDIRTSLNNDGPDGATNHNTSSENNEDGACILLYFIHQFF